MNLKRKRHGYVESIVFSDYVITGDDGSVSAWPLVDLFIEHQPVGQGDMHLQMSASSSESSGDDTPCQVYCYSTLSDFTEYKIIQRN